MQRLRTDLRLSLLHTHANLLYFFRSICTSHNLETQLKASIACVTQRKQYRTLFVGQARMLRTYTTIHLSLIVIDAGFGSVFGPSLHSSSQEQAQRVNYTLTLLLESSSQSKPLAKAILSNQLLEPSEQRETQILRLLENV